MDDQDYIRCPCGAKALNFGGDVHEYLLAVPGCWAMFNEVLEREYSDYGYARVHHLTVDSYTSQHPGNDTPQAINSVGVHLSSLYMVLERNLPLGEAARFKQTLAKANKAQPLFEQLRPPPSFGPITVERIWEATTPEQHSSIAREWASSVWQAWKPRHEKVKAWAHSIDFEFSPDASGAC